MKHLQTPVRVDVGAGRVTLRDADGKNILDLEHHRDLCDDLMQAVNKHDQLVSMLRRTLTYLKGYDISKEIHALLTDEPEENQSIIGQVLKEKWDDDGSDPELDIDVTPEELREEEEAFLKSQEDDNPDSTFYD